MHLKNQKYALKMVFYYTENRNHEIYRFRQVIIQNKIMILVSLTCFLILEVCKIKTTNLT